MHISLGIHILLVFFGDSGDAYFTRDPYTPGILGIPGMHIISLGIPILLVFFGDSGDAYFTRGPCTCTSSVLGTPGMHISLGIPILPAFRGLRGCICH
jgi:hypothetical protein